MNRTPKAHRDREASFTLNTTDTRTASKVCFSLRCAAGVLTDYIATRRRSGGIADSDIETRFSSGILTHHRMRFPCYP